MMPVPMKGQHWAMKMQKKEEEKKGRRLPKEVMM